MNRHRVSVVNRLPKRKATKPIIVAVCTALELFEAPGGEVTVALASPAELAELNEQFRNVRGTTDVLTFPAPAHIPGQLGDVILNWEMAEQQARRRGVRPVDEAAMLAVHGTLHLLGFDDHTESDRAKMVEAMNQVMNVAGLPQDMGWFSLPHGPEVEFGG